MNLVSILNNMSNDRDIFEFLRDRELREFSVQELDEALIMLNLNPKDYNNKADKLSAIINYYRPK